MDFWFAGSSSSRDKFFESIDYRVVTDNMCTYTYFFLAGLLSRLFRIMF